MKSVITGLLALFSLVFVATESHAIAAGRASRPTPTVTLALLAIAAPHP